MGLYRLRHVMPSQPALLPPAPPTAVVGNSAKHASSCAQPCRLEPSRLRSLHIQAWASSCKSGCNGVHSQHPDPKRQTIPLYLTLLRLKCKWQPLPACPGMGLGSQVTARPCLPTTVHTTSRASSSLSAASRAGTEARGAHTQGRVCLAGEGWGRYVGTGQVLGLLGTA